MTDPGAIDVKDVLLDLKRIGVDTEIIMKSNPTPKQLRDLLDGLVRIRDRKLSRFIIALIQK